jgi:hypothetical protein
MLEARESVWRLEDCSVEVTADRKHGRLQGRGIFPQLATRLVGPSAEACLERRSILDLLQSVPQLDRLLRETFGEGLCRTLGRSDST